MDNINLIAKIGSAKIGENILYTDKKIFRNDHLGIYFNGKFSFDDLRFAMEFPSIPSAERRINQVSIPGSMGDAYFDLGGYKDITIPLKFKAVDKDNLMAKFRKLKNLCNNIKDNRLILSYDPDYCYLVQYVKPITLSQKYLIYGELTINFVCKPHMYTVDGLDTREASTSLTIEGIHEAYPLIKLISPEELTTTETTINLTINGGVRTYQFSNYILIDSEEEVVYGANGVIDEAYFVSGVGYPKLEEGINTISVDRGTFEITPRFRCL